MFPFKSELQAITKPPTEHPWAHHIKDQYSNRIKYSHNSIQNPTYPKKTYKIPPELDREQFIVIGDRITREFIYCVKLVKGLHKYRKKSFDAPVIRGVTTVEWPSIWNDLKIRYGGLAYCLRSSVAVLLNDKIIGGEKELKQLVETKYTYHLSLNYHQEAVAEFVKFIRSSGRPCAYMNIAIKGEHIGTFIFMLYSDVVPYTCENFLRLCREKRGGYSGTPIHRIVKDGWIQGGGFKLKNTNLGCENFIIPHDRRGVLCMANAGRHIKCSTQFFILLQPAPWMDQKFVAFGELIEGKNTLDKIEAVPTFYESPTCEIMITQAGIFNMDCHHIIINKGTNEYIDNHIEDLNALGTILYETLIEKVFLTAQLREIERLREVGGEGAEQESEDEDTQHSLGKDGAASVRETQRFNRRKEDIEKQLESDKQPASRLPSSVTRPNSVTRRTNSPNAQENNEFDVETYDPEYEETDYQHQKLPPSTPSLIVKPKKPYYLPLTDVPYPGERDSHFDLKRFLQGDYCHESDLQKYSGKDVLHQERLSFPSDLFNLNDESETVSEENSSLDSDDDKAVKRYLKANVDRVSFAGGIIRNIAKGAAKINIFDDRRKSELITDDALRRLRLASIDYRNINMRDKKVSISIPNDPEPHMKIKRRQTGFVRPEDLEKIHIFQKHADRDDDDDDDGNEDNDNDDRDDDDDDHEEHCHRKVSISVPGMEHHSSKIKRRQTGFVRSEDLEKIHTFQKIALDVDDDDYDDNDDDDDDDDYNPRKVRIAASAEPTTEHHLSGRRPTGYVRAEDIPEENEMEYRQSVLVRLLDDVKGTEEPPTLKDYKPMSESHQKNILLTFSPNYRIKSEENTKDKYLRHSVTIGAESYEHVLNLQHGKKVARKVSSDYVKTIDQIEHVPENSIRSVEFAKIRPAISVSDYQKKNKKYRASVTDDLVGKRGLRLPGDSPLYHGSTEQDRKQNVL